MDRFNVSYKIEVFFGGQGTLLGTYRLNGQQIAIQPHTKMEIVLHGDANSGVIVWVTKVVWIDKFDRYEVDGSTIVHAPADVDRIKRILQENGWTK